MGHDFTYFWGPGNIQVRGRAHSACHSVVADPYTEATSGFNLLRMCAVVLLHICSTVDTEDSRAMGELSIGNTRSRRAWQVAVGPGGRTPITSPSAAAASLPALLDAGFAKRPARSMGIAPRSSLQGQLPLAGPYPRAQSR